MRKGTPALVCEVVPEMKTNLFLFLLFLLLLLPAVACALETGLSVPEDIARRIERGIEKNRKSAATVRVLDSQGRPVPGARITVRQRTHEFLFGCAFPNWDIAKQQPNPNDWARFEEHYLRLFNFATTENMLKWPSLERTEGQPDYTMVDSFVDWCEKNNITIKGHCLVWGVESYGPPKWLRDHGPEDVERITREHVLEVVRRYKGRISIWDVVNEPLHCHWFRDNMGPDYVEKSYRWAQEANSEAVLVLNEYGNQWNNQAPEFVRYAAELEKKGARIDVLGEQAHDAPALPGPHQVFEMLDTLASTGKDVHITEVTWPSNGAETASEFHKGRWTEEVQGDFYRYYYMLCFSHPNVKAITLWAMWDGASWLDQGGIITKDWRLKPAYTELDSLINREWRTNVEGRTFADGTFTFRGFHGDYEVQVDDGKPVEMRLSGEADGAERVLTVNHGGRP